MATKRGICPYCKINNIQHSIFLVNPEATTVFCGTNMHQLNPNEAINAYEAYIERMIKKADDTLNIVCNPFLAYQEYADVIEIDDSYIRPYLGRILCLVYMSKVRKSHLMDAKLLLEVGIEKNLSKATDAPIVFNFLRKIVHVTEEYLAAVKKRLTFKQYFYDTDCLSLYLTHVKETKDLENGIFEAATSLKKKYDSEKIDSFLNLMDEKISEKERILNEYEHITVNGKTYKYEMSLIGDRARIKEVVKRKIVDTKTSRYRMASLNPDDKSLRFIKDEVFKDYTQIIKARKRSVFWFIFFYLLAIASGVCIYLFKDNFPLFISFIVAAAFMFIMGTIFLSLNISWGTQINKKRRKLEVY